MAAEFATLCIPSLFDLTDFVGVGEPSQTNPEIPVSQMPQKPEKQSSFAHSVLLLFYYFCIKRE
jgi:hypothetical protein